MLRYTVVRSYARVYPIQWVCKVVHVTRAGYYAWNTRELSLHAQEDQRITTEITQLFTKKRLPYGSLRVHALLNQRGIRCGHNRVARLMRIAGVRAAAQRRRFRYPVIAQTEAKIFPNLVNRQFTVPTPNTVWLTDITFITMRSQTMYLATVIDLYSRRIVGWKIDLTRKGIAESALQQAILLRNPAPGLIVHSDRGSEFTSIAYANVCASAGIRQSFSRVGNCWDNAPMERFFASLKTEMEPVSGMPYRLAYAAVADYIDTFYNRERLHSTNKYCAPAVYEAQSIVSAIDPTP